MQCARKIESEIDDPRVGRDGQELTIELADGTSKRYADVFDTPEDTIAYTALEPLLDWRYLLIHLQFYEGSGFLLLNRSNGEEFRLDGYPMPSPDGRHLVTASLDLLAGYDPNVLRIYEAHPDQIHLVFDAGAEAGDWAPYFARWQDSRSLVYGQATYDCYYEDADCETFELTLRGNGWQKAKRLE